MSEEIRNDMEEVKEPVTEAAAQEEPKAAEPAEPVETMEDYSKELEASFRRIKEGDVLTGTVIGVDDDKVVVDLKYYAEGIIKREDVSGDPSFSLKENVHVGEEITATVLKTDDGEGNILLSGKEAREAMLWDKLTKMLEDRAVVTVKIAEVVKSGVVAYLEGIRGFIPASKLTDGYVENLDEWKGKSVEVTVITVDPVQKRLVLSGREVAREKAKAEKAAQIAKCEVGAVMEGAVDSIKPYGAFINLDNGLSGLLHVSQISDKRIKSPDAVLKEGQKVTVKIIAIKDGKISLSMKALIANQEEVRDEGPREYRDSQGAVTGLGALLAGFKFDK